ncbi:hypothetical protein F5Y13DRAFT_199391 [Hypoxylon sp. FL1857]|nr:hypothetical protein F5Y13DRAFT_199391 [Hypoxylon sp. FL1857]
MATKQSRQLRRAFCQRARQRDPILTSFFARGAKGSRGQYGQNDMSSITAFSTKYFPDRNNNEYGRASKPTVTLQTRLPNDVYKITLRPATRCEIYGVALGTCFLILLLGWFLLVGIRAGLASFTKKTDKASQDTDPENGLILEAPEQSRSIMSKLRKVSAEELIKSARRTSLDVATGIKRDIGEFRRINHSARHRMDEEAGLDKIGRGGMEENGPFLRRKRKVEVA